MIADLGAGFWHFDVGQIITGCIVAVAWIVSRAMDWTAVKSEVRAHDKWLVTHEKESEKRDSTINQLGMASVKLTTLLEAMEYRMQALERARSHWNKEG